MFGLLVAAPMVLGSERFGPRGESMGSVKVVLFSTGNSAATNRYCSSPLIFLFIFSTIDDAKSGPLLDGWVSPQPHGFANRVFLHNHRLLF